MELTAPRKNIHTSRKNYYLIRELLLIVQSSKHLSCEYKMKLIIKTLFITFSLFFLRGVAPSSIKTRNMYKGVIPFIGIQVLAILIVGFYPEIATWLPNKMF